jgi:hypothetical protein
MKASSYLIPRAQQNFKGFESSSSSQPRTSVNVSWNTCQKHLFNSNSVPKEMKMKVSLNSKDLMLLWMIVYKSNSNSVARFVFFFSRSATVKLARFYLNLRTVMSLMLQLKISKIVPRMCFQLSSLTNTIASANFRPLNDSNYENPKMVI